MNCCSKSISFKQAINPYATKKPYLVTYKRFTWLLFDEESILVISRHMDLRFDVFAMHHMLSMSTERVKG